MSLFGLFAVLITATAALAWVNERFVRLPSTIGVMAAALALSLVMILAGGLGFGVDEWAESLLERIDFNTVLMNGMLSFLLFAGALHVDLGGLLARKWVILSLATLGVVLSALTLGALFYFVTGLFGFEVPFVWAVLFGAIVSPTDPIAVLGILRQAKAPEALESMVIGESLFNDGVGVVVFSLLLGLATGGHHAGAADAIHVFAVEALGGAVFGLGLGYLAYRVLRTIDNHVVEILITLALVSGGYYMAGSLHMSGPIAMVTAGLFIGNHGRAFGMTDASRDHLDSFWEVVDEILNALLFTLIGFELLVLELDIRYLGIAALMIPAGLLVRLGCVGVPIGLLGRRRAFPKRIVPLMTWGGIRGGISVALALALPSGAYRDLILFVTYAVVVFSILVQGLTMGRAVGWLGARS